MSKTLTFLLYFIILWHIIYLLYHFYHYYWKRCTFSTFKLVLFGSMVVLLFAVQILIIWGSSQVDFFYQTPEIFCTLKVLAYYLCMLHLCSSYYKNKFQTKSFCCSWVMANIHFCTIQNKTLPGNLVNIGLRKPLVTKLIILSIPFLTFVLISCLL